MVYNHVDSTDRVFHEFSFIEKYSQKPFSRENKNIVPQPKRNNCFTE